MRRLAVSCVAGLLATGCAHRGAAVFEGAPAVRIIQGEAGKLAVEDGGRGEALPVVFVHGMLGSREAFRPQLEHVRRTRRAVALDLRGMGESDPDPQGRYGPLPFAEDLASAVDALRLDRFILVAHSFGAAVAIEYAARFPRRVAGILFVDGVGDFRHLSGEEVAGFRTLLAPDRYAAFIDGYYREVLENASPEVTEEVVATAKAAPREVMVQGWEAMRTYDSAARWRQYDGPRRAIVAQQFVGPQSLHVLHGIPVRVMAGVSHWLMRDQPEAFNAELDAFLAAIGR